MLVNRKKVYDVEVQTPSGIKLKINLIDQELGNGFARCAVIKDSGDDPDVTDGSKVCAKVRLSDNRGVVLKGGEGVGKATRPGLAIGVGEWAINPTPRKMIMNEASKFLPDDKGLEVTISVPGGEELAKKTYNPRLGIVGGISIIGTTGIVEPKSLDAYKASLALELNVFAAQGSKRVVFVLGYVGEKYCRDVLRLESDSVIKIGDHVGFMLEEAAKRNIKEALLIGHIGKLIKVAGGQFNTHSKFGDNRIDAIAGYARACGADKKTTEEISRQTTAEAATEILRKNGLMKVCERITQDVSANSGEFVKNKIRIDCVLLSLEGKVLGTS